jgi:outer membrane receptor for ferrienterochelin and colicin
MKNFIRTYCVTAILLFISATLPAQIDTTGVNRLFEMSMAELMDQEVVTSSKFVQRSAETASSVSIITAEDLKNYSYSTLGEALNSIRGIYLSDDRNYQYVGSRGFSRPTDYNNRILVMIDGHIMNEVVYGSAFMGNDLGLNLKNVEKIEIIHGPGASLYGTGAMLNLVNIIMKKGSGTNGVQLSAGTGSFGRNEFSAIYGRKIRKIDFSLSGIGGISKGENFYFRELDAPETNSGISSGMDKEKFGGFQASLTWDNFRLSGSYSSRFKGIPTGAFGSDLTGDVSTTDSRSFIEASYRKDFRKGGLLVFRTYFDSYNYNGTYDTRGTGIYDRSVNNWGGVELQHYIETGKRNIIISGIEYKNIFSADYKEWDNSDVYFNKDFPYSFFSLYGHDQFTLLKNLTLTGGLRFDTYSRFGNALSPRAALVYEYSKASSVKLLYTEAFRIPNIYESFYESLNSAKSNPNIKPERIKTFEIAWGHRISEKLYGSLSLYDFKMNNLIDQVLDPSDSLTLFRNVNKAIGKGLEIELRYKQNSRLNGFINMAFQNARDPDLDKSLSNSPNVLIKSGLVFPVTKVFTFSPEFFYESGRYTLKGNKTEDVYLVNLTIRTAKFLKYFDLSVKARNIFDRKYYYPGGYEHVQDVIVQSRRNIFLQLNAQF